MENNDDLTKAFEALGEVIASVGVTIWKAADVFAEAFQNGYMKINIDAQIAAVKASRELNCFQKWRRIRELKKLKKELEREGEDEP